MLSIATFLDLYWGTLDEKVYFEQRTDRMYSETYNFRRHDWVYV